MKKDAHVAVFLFLFKDNSIIAYKAKVPWGRYTGKGEENMTRDLTGWQLDEWVQVTWMKIEGGSSSDLERAAGIK